MQRVAEMSLRLFISTQESSQQKEYFTCDMLKNFLINQVPLVVGIQYNENYAVYYTFKEGKIIKIILSFKPDTIKIVTMVIVEKWQLPRGKYD